MRIVRNSAISGTAHDVYCAEKIAVKEDVPIWVMDRYISVYKINIIIECLKTFREQICIFSSQRQVYIL